MSEELDRITSVVLAGGYGTRVQHLLPGVPKPMAEVAGKPFLEWVVRYLGKQGIRRVVLSTGYLAEVVERHFEKSPIAGVTTRCVPEIRPLGTGGGFLHAARTAGDKPLAWLVMNGDSLAFADLTAVAAPLADDATSGVVVGRLVPDASRYGTLGIGSAGELLRFLEKQPGSGVINSGIYLLRHSLLSQFPDQTPLSLERDVFPSWLARGMRLQTVVTEAPFLDIGTPESLPQAEDFIRQNMEQFLIA
ncbi:MAG TPA: sugar phosphate nucleotidyltransferase [Verrucomicrobiae bacterium]|jgi:D-glycero-alpha-D-manno-heptose 1-phosphate guanylyltransferase|nr:sugar phosphate nucleotidyltransferase [Verrucomicrobiae bacterium]